MAGDALLALSVLSRLSAKRGPVKISELDFGDEVSRSSLYRITRDLEGAGWIKAEGSPKRYSVTWNTIQVGVAGLAQHPVREVMIPYAIEFSRVSGRGCALSFYNRGEVIWTDRIRVTGARVSINLGIRRAPAASVASGKILLAHQSEEEILRVANLGLPRMATHTKTTPEEILADIRETRERGYGLSHREHTNTRSGLAFAVLNASGQAIAALSVGSSSSDDLEQLVRGVSDAARQMTEIASAEMGYRDEAGDGFD